MAYVVLTAISHEGFGKEESYSQTYSLGTSNHEAKLESLKRQFSLKYGVPLDLIEVRVKSVFRAEGEYSITK